MRYLALVLISGMMSLMLVSCSDKEQTKSEKGLKLGVVVAISNVDDKSFNENIWDGVMKYAKENHLPQKNIFTASSPTEDDLIINLSNFADNKLDLIIATGFNFLKPINIVAKKYPHQKFLLLDARSNLQNVYSVSFASNDGSFLAGIYAALKAKELKNTKIGFLGGMKIGSVKKFEAGFRSGVKKINPKLEVVVRYADDFSNPTKGKRMASKMYDEGIGVIFNVAGSTGNGIIEEAKRRALNGEDVWVIGVDKDQYKDGIYKDGKSVVLTSMLKKLDVATYDVINLVKKGALGVKDKIYTLKEDGVGFPKNNPNLKPEWVKIVEPYKADIISGKIVVPDEKSLR